VKESKSWFLWNLQGTWDIREVRTHTNWECFRVWILFKLEARSEIVTTTFELRKKMVTKNCNVSRTKPKNGSFLKMGHSLELICVSLCTLNVILENVKQKLSQFHYILKIWIDRKWVHISQVWRFNTYVNGEETTKGVIFIKWVFFYYIISKQLKTIEYHSIFTILATNCQIIN
jgi:hypothetical protein